MCPPLLVRDEQSASLLHPEVLCLLRPVDVGLGDFFFPFFFKIALMHPF